MPQTYPKRLIEVDLPIKRISAHARREKSIRHGHISTLHIWWARRPLAACRAVICASLWPDPADELCPAAFRDKVRAEMLTWTSHERQRLLSEESRKRFEKARQKPALFDDTSQLRSALLNFIADFANWDNSTVKEYLETSRALTQAAHEALGGAPGTRPLVVDPFAGGGSIPLEALRVGADAFASDLNPVAVLLNKTVLEYIPKYGQRLADEVRNGGEWIKREAEKELAEFYPTDPDGATPIAYLWVRRVQCEGPGCGADVPLIRSLWLAKKASRSIALKLVPDLTAKRVNFEIVQDVKPREVGKGTVAHGSVTCPCCDFTMRNELIRTQLAKQHGGAKSSRLIVVVTLRAGLQGRSYRLATKADVRAVEAATQRLTELSESGNVVPIEAIPKERPSPNARGLSAVTRMGMVTFGDLFGSRQALWLATLTSILRNNKGNFETPVATLLAFALGRQADQQTSLVTWLAGIEAVSHTFTRQALQIAWDYIEPNPFSDSGGNWDGSVEWVSKVCEHVARSNLSQGNTQRISATAHPLPSDSASVIATDPPYYDSVPYADLSDFFYVWLRRALPQHSEVMTDVLTPKDNEAIWNPSRVQSSTGRYKDIEFYEDQMRKAFDEARRVIIPSGIAVVVFAHKSTSGWEAILSALVGAGWFITASWPIDTERGNRVNAIGTASLASSVHIVCRPRENPDGSVRADEIGDWREVLQELPRRIHEWMPRLAEEGVVGADAIFACLGPALEIFSRYSGVEKASGEAVTLKEYLECVWAAVAKEALTIIFPDADTIGFEEDARLTAMWLWTLNAGNTNGEGVEKEEPNDEPEDDTRKVKVAGFFLEYDAARKIAQGLGAHLEDLDSLVEVSGETARLLPVGERARTLFGKDEGKIPPQRKKREPQMNLFKVFEEIEDSETTFGDSKVARLGETVLDRIHQSMILFAAGRGEALKHLLVENGVGQDQRFWRLAQALSALYPSHTEEKRWVDGVLARKKGLGF